MDYRRFLGSTATSVLPYLGGIHVHARDRRLRLDGDAAVGWWRFEVSGRKARPLEPTDAPELSDLPNARGHLLGSWLFVGGTRVERLFLMPDEEPAPFTPATGRRWPSGDHLHESFDFEDESEIRAREALFEERTTLEHRAGMTPSLKAAFGLAVLERRGRARGLRVSPLGLLDRLHEICTGQTSADVLLDELEARRFVVRPEHRRPTTRPRPTTTSPEDRAVAALSEAGADFVSGRSLDETRYEVTFRLAGETFIAVVDPTTMHVYDSGICLEGHDEDLGLHALPAVILEAIATRQLHITRR